MINHSITLAQNDDLLIRYNDISVTVHDKSLPYPWESGINSSQFNQADLDGDDKEELIILDRNSRQIHVFSFIDGQYVPQPDYINILPNLNRDWVIFADYDCDGRKDIFNYRTGGVTVYRNISTNGLAQWEITADPLRTLGFSGLINLVVNSPDVPAIEDIDDDGDLDILYYNFALGEDIRLSQNRSVEKTGNCAGLDFEITDRTWGSFKECFCHVYAFEGKTCAEVIGGRVTHTSGKSLVLYDMNDDNVKDIFLSHSDCDDLIFLENVGSIDSAHFTGFHTEFPLGTTPVSMPIYPTVKFIDINSDQKTDMLASPNIDFNFEFKSDFSNSVWLYQAEGVNGSADFKLVKKNFLQDQMIDLGEMSQPVFFDFDRDGDQDLFVAANGEELGSVFYGYVTVFENVGNVFQPEFRLSDEDFLDLSSLKLTIPKIRFADFNHDGEVDLFFCGYDLTDGVVKSFLFFDQSGGKGPAAFSLTEKQQVQLPLLIFENPEFTDVNGDGEPDLLVGFRDGTLNLYENRGEMIFELAEGDYLGIGRDFSLTKLNVFPLVTDYDFDGNVDLIIADAKDLSVYYDFKNASEPAPVLLKSHNTYLDTDDSISMQFHNSVAVADLFGSDSPGLMLGGSGGGLSFFRNKQEVDNPGSVKREIKIYPNPVSRGDNFRVESYNAGILKMYNLWGQLVGEFTIREKSVSEIDTHTLAAGVYLLSFVSDSGIDSVNKLIITD